MSCHYRSIDCIVFASGIDLIQWWKDHLPWNSSSYFSCVICKSFFLFAQQKILNSFWVMHWVCHQGVNIYLVRQLHWFKQGCFYWFLKWELLVTCYQFLYLYLYIFTAPEWILGLLRKRRSLWNFYKCTSFKKKMVRHLCFCLFPCFSSSRSSPLLSLFICLSYCRLERVLCRGAKLLAWYSKFAGPKQQSTFTIPHYIFLPLGRSKWRCDICCWKNSSVLWEAALPFGALLASTS